MTDSPDRPPTRPAGLPDVEGGTHPPGPETYQHPLLRAHGEAIAQETTRLFFAAWPELEARYGERGRRFTYSDNFWHFSTLDTAMRLDSPGMWTDYVVWLRDFIRGRGMTDAITCANFVFFKRQFAALTVPAGQHTEREKLMSYLDMAIDLFPEDARTPPEPPTP
jgi:hypothetical protein